jgi:hypothetical protein
MNASFTARMWLTIIHSARTARTATLARWADENVDVSGARQGIRRGGGLVAALAVALACAGLGIAPGCGDTRTAAGTGSTGGDAACDLVIFSKGSDSACQSVVDEGCCGEQIVCARYADCVDAVACMNACPTPRTQDCVNACRPGAAEQEEHGLLLLETCVSNNAVLSGECSWPYDACLDGQVSCQEGNCVDTLTDPSNCGGCFAACPTGATCSAGKCACPSSTVACGGACVDTQSDALHCGACEQPCSDSATCSGGACVCSGTTSAYCFGECVNTNTDESHCGGCDQPCMQGGVCVVGECKCPGTKVDCSGTCVDTKNDESHCGSCDQACSTLGSVCAGGKCGCPGGQVDCSGTCVDTKTDESHCGSCDQACSTLGSVCAGGQCGCPGAQVDCSGTCVDTGNDVAHCGACTTICSAPANASPTCVAGGCGFDCGAYTTCADACCLSVASAITAPVVGEINCALVAAGRAKCWGENAYGDVGDGTTTDRHAPTDVKQAGFAFAALDGKCGITENGALKCWGNNFSGQLGNGTQTDSSVPVDVSGLGSGVLAVSSSAFVTCAVTGAGAVKCWGSNFFGQLGNGTTTDSSVPVSVVGLQSGVVAVAVGTYHACALTGAGGVKCWGSNDYGQLGDGTKTQSSVPVAVAGLASGVVAVSAGGYVGGAGHSCALTSTGGVKCWGGVVQSAPSDVSGLTAGVTAISSGGHHACAVTAAGGVKCWALGGFFDFDWYGQLGDGTQGPPAGYDPVDVAGLAAGVVAVAAGQDHTCALTTAGAVQCWGRNTYGEVGDGTLANRYVPTQVVGF